MPGPVSFSAICPCGASVAVEVHTLVNAEAQPGLVAQMQAGLFHQGTCRRCGKHLQVDKWFLFQDAPRDLLVHVFPRAYRHAYLSLQAQLEPLHKLCGLASEGPVHIVFGIDGLLALLRGEPAAPPVVFPEAMPNYHTRH